MNLNWQPPNIKRMFNVQTVLWLTMALALLGSLRHVAWTFGSIDGDSWWGWAQAIAIDAGLVALALGIAKYRRVRRDTRWLWVGVVVFSAISVYANAVYGVSHDWQVPDTVLQTLPIAAQVPDWLLAIKVLILAAPLPLLTLYLAEIVGSDVNREIQDAEKAEVKDKNRQIRELRRELEAARAQLDDRELTPRERFERNREKYDDCTQQQIADEIGVSRQTISKWQAEVSG